MARLRALRPNTRFRAPPPKVCDQDGAPILGAPSHAPGCVDAATCPAAPASAGPRPCLALRPGQGVTCCGGGEEKWPSSHIPAQSLLSRLKAVCPGRQGCFLAGGHAAWVMCLAVLAAGAVAVAKPCLRSSKGMAGPGGWGVERKAAAFACQRSRCAIQVAGRLPWAHKAALSPGRPGAPWRLCPRGVKLPCAGALQRGRAMGQGSKNGRLRTSLLKVCSQNESCPCDGRRRRPLLRAGPQPRGGWLAALGCLGAWAHGPWPLRRGRGGLAGGGKGWAKQPSSQVPAQSLLSKFIGGGRWRRGVCGPLRRQARLLGPLAGAAWPGHVAGAPQAWRPWRTGPGTGRAGRVWQRGGGMKNAVFACPCSKAAIFFDVIRALPAAP